MSRHSLIFIGGMHRSGTTLLHEILRAHPAISGFEATGVKRDEGQHLQTVYPPASDFGGPGRFGFNPASFMDETHPLATPDNAGKLFAEWRPYWDLEKQYLLEKSPPNLVRTRFLQQLFPSAHFIILLRHPVAVAYATRKWCKTSIPSLIEHSLLCYERFEADRPFLQRVRVIRYEELVFDPRTQIQGVLDWMGLAPFDFSHSIDPCLNDKYFAQWKADRKSALQRWFGILSGWSAKEADLEKRSLPFGYSLREPGALLPLKSKQESALI